MIIMYFTVHTVFAIRHARYSFLIYKAFFPCLVNKAFRRISEIFQNMYTLRQKVVLWALYTRVFVLVIQFFINIALKQTEPLENIDENSENSTFTWIKIDSTKSENDENLNFSDIVFLLFGALVPKSELEVQHNLHIANNGYTYESNLLYFPLYSLMVKGLGDSVTWFTKDLGLFDGMPPLATPAVIVCCSLLLNVLFFVFAADRLYLLSRKVLK